MSNFLPLCGSHSKLTHNDIGRTQILQEDPPKLTRNDTETNCTRRVPKITHNDTGRTQIVQEVTKLKKNSQDFLCPSGNPG